MTKQEFIQTIAPIIQKYAKAKGYKVCSAIIAQACLESGYGSSLLSTKYHNYFGMKCGTSWKGKSVNMATKEEYKVGTLTDIRANFRAYDSMEAGVSGYFDFISTNRYAKLKGATSPEQYLTLIKEAGYATSSKYVNTNMQIIGRYNLTKYDTMEVQEPTTPSIRVGSVVKVVRAVQYNGKPFKTFHSTYDVIEVKGDRIVIGKGKVVTCAINKANISVLKY